MGCDFPIRAHRSPEFLESGKRALTFNPVRSVNSNYTYNLPCNSCMGCRLERSRQWAIRMLHESKAHDFNCFITLTYDDQHVPQDYGLKLRDWQLFMKKLRKSLTVKMKHRRGEHSAHIRAYCLDLTPKLRFFACGEYGSLNGRPHYHAIIFNHDFFDKKEHGKNAKGDIIYSSEWLARLWGKGLVSTQDVTFKSARYVAAYVTKKITGDKAPDHYYRLSPIDGQMHSVKPEFAVMSRRDGLGSCYVDQFKSDFYPSGFIVVDGKKHSPPAFYKRKLAEKEQQDLQRQAARAGLKHKEHQTTARRVVRATVRDARIKQLKRDL